MVEKVIRDGKVAVLYSRGFGAGWSSWVSGESAKISLFHPDIVKWVEGGKKEDINEIMERLIADKSFYTGGAKNLDIEWLPVGTMFRINEYDGSETVETNDSVEWMVA